MKNHLLRSLTVAVVMSAGCYALAEEPPTSNRPDQAIAGAPKSLAQTEHPSAGKIAAAVGTSDFVEASRSPAKAYSQMDPAFSTYVDLSVLSQAVAGPDASLLTDVALGLAEGERILVRKHRSGLSADELMIRATKLAVHSADEATLKRITATASDRGKPQWAKLAAESREFGEKSRGGPTVPLGKLNSETMALLETVRRACDVTELTGDKSKMDSLKRKLVASGLDIQVKTYLTNMIDGCLMRLPESNDVSSTVLREFSAASRDRSFEVINMTDKPVNVAFARKVDGGVDGINAPGSWSAVISDGWHVIAPYDRRSFSAYGQLYMYATYDPNSNSQLTRKTPNQFNRPSVLCCLHLRSAFNYTLYTHDNTGMRRDATSKRDVIFAGADWRWFEAMFDDKINPYPSYTIRP